MIVDSGKFDWAANRERFRRLNEPDVSYHGMVYTEAVGDRSPTSSAPAWCLLRNMGAAIAPHTAFLALQGLETLPLRMDRICDNTLAVARHLRAARTGGVGALRGPRRQPAEAAPRQVLRRGAHPAS